MNWNEIEKLVNKYRSRFDEEEPSPHHLSSFETKLTQRLKQSYIFGPRKLLRIAVYIGIIIASSFLSTIIYFNVRQNAEKNTYITQTAVELQETEKYYTEQINSSLKRLRSLKMTDQKQKKAIFSDLNDMDKNYEQLKNDLKKNPNDDRLAHAIIEHYQVKLDAIDQVINSLSFIQNNLKPQNHEQNI